MATERERDKNPINRDERDRQAQEPERILPDLESDSFSTELQKKIVQMVMDDFEIGKASQAEWKEKKRIDLMHINGEKPSIIEGLSKKGWMSDRNLNLTAATCDIYQATLLGTCYNPDSIHFKDTEQNDVDNKDNLERFTKWALGPSEANFFPEVDDFISNRVNLGTSFFKIYWESKYEWVDKRIPIPAKDGSRRIVGYKIETERRLFERGVIKNIDELDDIFTPTYGKGVQDLKFFIETIHLTYEDLEDLSERGIIVNFEANTRKFTGLGPPVDKLRNEDEKALGLNPVVASVASSDADKRSTPIDILEWYGTLRKDNRTEKFRIWVEPKTWTFLGGKPLRKVNRTGKIPYVGGPLRRRPGFLRGLSLPSLIAGAVGAINNAFNQLSDFQYWENLPERFYDKNGAEGLDAAIQDAEPGKWTGTDGDPNKIIFSGRMGQRSMAWAYQYIDFLMQVIERLTGAASYFLTTNQPDTTATRDNIVEQKGEVKFGLWVKRIQSDISEAVNMFVQQYQDWAPPNLAKRVLGEDGKAIIKNLSINSIRGMYDAYMVPDITSGSKAFERQTALWGFQVLQGGSVWFDPRMNPRGNWLLTKEAMKKQGISNPEHFLPPQPKEQGDYNKEAEAHFNQLMQGDQPEPPGSDNPQIVQCLATFLRLKETRYQDLDEEYRPNFDAYFFKAYKNYNDFMMKIAQEQMIMRVASQAAGNLEKMGMAPHNGARPAVAPVQPAAAPGGPGMGLPGGI